MRNSFVIFRLVIITAIFAICGCSESITPIDLSCPLSNSGFGPYHFGASVKTNPSFDLHSPPNALYAKVENDSLELRLEASRRKDATMAWLMMSMSDKHLLKEADIEYDRISKDESTKEEVTERRNRANWLAPLSYAMPLYVVFYYGHMTFAIVVLFAISMAILFPTLPE